MSTPTITAEEIESRMTFTFPIGEGTIDFPSIFRALVRAGYQETVTLEVPHSHLALSVQKLRQIVEP